MGTARAAEPCPPVGAATAAVLARVRALADDKRFDAAEACLNTALAARPDDRDLGSQLVRVLTWEGRFAAADAALARWPRDDAEGLELAGDLAWYRRHHAEAVVHYEAALSRRHFDRDATALWRRYLRAARAQADDETYARALGLVQAHHVLGLEGEIAAARPVVVRARAGAAYYRYQQSQAELDTETQVAAGAVAAAWSLQLVGSSLARNVGAVHLHDRPLSVEGMRRWSETQRTEVALGATAQPRFSYERQALLRHEIKLSTSTYAGADWRWTRYEPKTTTGVAVYGGAYLGPWHGDLKVFTGASGESDRAVLVRVQREVGRLLPELSASAGRGEASRPYLLARDSAFFRAVGAKLTYESAGGRSVFGLAEWRAEPEFFQRLLGGGLACKL